MQEWWNAYAAERLLAAEILAWGAFLVVMFMLIAMASIKYQQAFMTYFRADDVPADEFLAQQNRAFAVRHSEMLDNGFSMWQTMRLKCANPPFQAAMAVYRHEGRRSLVGVLYALNGQQACYTDIFEEYTDGSSLTVSNIPQAAHPLIPQLPIYNAEPHKSTVAQLCSLHQAICRKTRPAEPLAPSDGEPYSRRILYWLGRQREYLAQMGLVRAKPDIDGRYYYTWKGAASVTLRSFPVFRSLFVRALRRKTASLAEE